jgi:hypothetical protein
VLISGLVGERGAVGFGCSSRGGGHACNSKMLAKRFYAIGIVSETFKVARGCCSGQVMLENTKESVGVR